MDAVILLPRAWTSDVLGLSDVTLLVERTVRTCREAGCFDAVRVLADFPGLDGCSDVDVLQTAESLGGSPSLIRKAARVQSALSSLSDAPAQTIMLVNPLAARLGSRTLRQGAEIFSGDAETPLVSVEAPRDHPCQLYSLSRIAAFGFAPLFDSGAVARTSAVFSFNWAARNGRDLPENTLLREDPGISGVRYVLASAEEELSVPFLWEKVSASTARIHVASRLHDALSRLARPGETLAGVGLDAERAFGEVLVFRKGGDCRLVLTAPARFSLGGRMSVIPVVSGRPRPDLACERVIPESGGCEMEIPLGREVTAVNYSIHENIEEGPGISKTPLFPETCLWRYDHRGVAHNKQSGLPISGRQQFPDVFSLNHAFLAFRTGGAGSVEERQGDGLAYCLVPDEETFFVRSKVDMLMASILEGETSC